MNLQDRLARLRLIVVTGKGGTGKSVMTAALGRVLAAHGRRTLLLEVDPRENLHHLCGVPPSGGEIVEAAPNLWLQNLKPETVADWVVARQVKIGMLVKRILASPIYHRFVEGAPGLTEIAILGHARRLVRGSAASRSHETRPHIDTVILDAPATGHGLYLLTAPRLFVETIAEGPFAELAREVAHFVDDPAQSGFVIVTLAEDMPVQEALELRAALLDKLGRAPEVLITNALYPPIGEADGRCVSPPRSPPGDDMPIESPQAAEASPGSLDALWRDRRQVNVKEIRRLSEHWEGPRLEIPLLPIDEGPHLVEALAELLDDALARAETAQAETP